MNERGSLTRRGFLRNAGQGAAALAAAGLLAEPSSRAAPVGANDKIVTGHIGVGGMGSGHLGWFLGQPDVEVAAICDVHAGRRDEAVARTNGRAKGYGDYRDVLARDDIDAVVIATPDHWHTLPTIHACQAGKDVYVEKPMTLTIEEGRAMINAARRYGRVVQVGTQQRADAHFREVVEYIRSGRIGKVTFARTWFPGGSGGGQTKVEPVPPELDWDMWLGPAPFTPYVPDRFFDFRMYRDYSGGRLTDWGTHLIDIVHWATGEDTPVSIVANGGNYVSSPTCDMPDTLEVLYEYPSFLMTWSQQLSRGFDGHDYGIQFWGTDGSIFVDRSGYAVFPEGKVLAPIGPGDFRLPRVAGHQREWLECIRTRERPTSDVAVGHRSTSAPHLGNIAYLLGRKLLWDGEKEQFIGDDEANRLVGKPYRAPWHL